VEHSCYQCGASVEDGTPFCRQCNAPQIRVATAEAIAPAEMAPESLSQPYSAALPSTRIDWPHALRAAALAVLVSAAIAMFVGFPFGFGVMSAGFLSVFFYSRTTPDARLTTAMGARLGALSGLFGLAACIVFGATKRAAFRFGGQVHEAFLKTLQEHAPRGADPQLMQQLFQFYKTPQGFALMMVGGSAIALVVFLVLSSLGGAIAAALLRRKQRL